VVQDKCVGVAIADNHLSKKNITKETIDFLEIVMNQAAVAIENIDLYQKQEDYTVKLKTTDHLTGIYNFSHFKKMLEAGIKDSEDNDVLYTLSIIYINNFNKFNEKNGHATGDSALKEIASILGKSVQEGDIVGRCYGSEFGIIFKNKDEKSSLDELNKIISTIQGTSFKGLDKLEEKVLTSKLAVRSYNIDDRMTCDEFFKKVEDIVRSNV
jgi:diguanylate cyclase (GGDEF)-like protein